MKVILNTPSDGELEEGSFACAITTQKSRESAFLAVVMPKHPSMRSRLWKPSQLPFSPLNDRIGRSGTGSLAVAYYSWPLTRWYFAIK